MEPIGRYPRRPRCPRCGATRGFVFAGELLTARDPGGSTHPEALVECGTCRHRWRTRHRDLLRQLGLLTRRTSP